MATDNEQTDNKQSAMTSKQVYFRLLGYVRPYWKVFAISVAATIVTALIEPAKPFLMKPLLDGTFVEKDPEMLKLMPFMLIAVIAGSGLAAFISTTALNWVAGKVIMDIRDALFNRVMTLPVQFFSDNTAGSLISKASYDANQLRNASTNVLITLIRDTIIVIGLLALMFYLDWQLTFLMFIIAPLIAIVIKLVSGRMRNRARDLQTAMGDMTHVLEEAINGNRVIKMFDGKAYETKRYNADSNWVRRFEMKVSVLSAANVPIVQTIIASSMASIIYLGVTEREMSVGAFVAFIGAMAMLSSPIKRLTNINEHLQRGIAAAESIFNVLDAATETDNGSRVLERAKGKVEFRALSFSYGANLAPALQDINLTIAPGETVALVGRSGSGKSTLANLVPRFFHADNGCVLIDDIDTSELSLESLRRNMALVSQDVVLFNDTIASNIAYGGKASASPEQIHEAIKAAHALEFIEKLPDGLETLIGEKGARLSGGQRQRLAIARALLKDAPILILDEATSALDTESERHVQAALETLKQGRTTLIIAHRLSTIENADRIVVMDKGQIIETGNHQQLLSQNGAYAKLYSLQFHDME